MGMDNKGYSMILSKFCTYGLVRTLMEYLSLLDTRLETRMMSSGRLRLPKELARGLYTMLARLLREGIAFSHKFEEILRPEDGYGTGDEFTGEKEGALKGLVWDYVEVIKKTLDSVSHLIEGRLRVEGDLLILKLFAILVLLLLARPTIDPRSNAVC